MANRDSGRIQRARRAREKRVTQSAGGVFDGAFLDACRCAHITRADLERDAKVQREFAAECLVAIRRGAA